MGSKLRDKTTGEIVWVDFKTIPRNPLKWDDWLGSLFRRMAYPNDDLEPAGIMDEILFVPPWAKQEHYGRLVRALERMGYCADASKYPEAELDVYSFAYDWRQDNRLSARQLGEAVERWSAHHPGAKAWLMGHSNGGIVSRWYIEKEGGKERVGKLFLFGSPWDGAPKGMRMVFGGMDTLFRPGFNLFNIKERTRSVIRSFPSAYQLIPSRNPFLHNANNELVDIFSGAGWLEDPQHLKYLEDGRRFNEDLGTHLSVPTLCFFGRSLPTTTAGLLSTKEQSWDKIQWLDTEAGDGTVPERSAVHPEAHQKLPFAATHGDIYVNDAVLKFLEWELVDQYSMPGEPERATVLTEALRVLFQPEKDTYIPDEPIQLKATLEDARTHEPVSGAGVEVKLEWREALPGSPVEAPAVSLPADRLWEDETMPGLYTGSLPAPTSEGYYRAQAVVKVHGQLPIQLEEMIAVEAPPNLTGV
jgi:pimeloyl-ACP methyl ester carboxylesterase